MNEHVMKEKIQAAYTEPQAPESLVEQVVLRTQAVTMGIDAQRQLETAPARDVAQLASRALIGQLATVTQLPEGTQPEELAHMLEREPAFQAALLGGNVARRVQSGQLMQQVAAQEPIEEQAPPELSVPVKEGPKMGR